MKSVQGCLLETATTNCLCACSSFPDGFCMILIMQCLQAILRSCWAAAGLIWGWHHLRHAPALWQTQALERSTGSSRRDCLPPAATASQLVPIFRRRGSRPVQGLQKGSNLPQRNCLQLAAAGARWKPAASLSSRSRPLQEVPLQDRQVQGLQDSIVAPSRWLQRSAAAGAGVLLPCARSLRSTKVQS